MFKSFTSIPSKYISREHFTKKKIKKKDNISNKKIKRENFSNQATKKVETVSPTAVPSESIVVQAAVMAANAADNVVDAASKVVNVVSGENVVDKKKECDDRLFELKESHKEVLDEQKVIIKNYERIIITQFVIITVVLLLYIYNTFIKK